MLKDEHFWSLESLQTEKYHLLEIVKVVGSLANAFRPSLVSETDFAIYCKMLEKKNQNNY